MKERFNKWWSEYFGYTRKERKGMIALAVILFLLVLANAYLDSRVTPPPNIQLVELKVNDSQEYREQEVNMPGSAPDHSPIHFDPNLADEKILVQVGFSPKQARSLMNYRESGGHFFKAEDLKKLYVMNDQLYEKLLPWVRINSVEKHDATQPKQNQPQPTKYPSAPQKIDLNLVDSLSLIAIRGIGPKTAKRVLRYRDWLGGYVDTAQLNEVWGLYPEQKAVLIAHCKLPLTNPKRLNINQAEQEELEGHPYIRFKAKVLLAYRKQHGPFMSIEDLRKTRVFSDSLIGKLEPYLEFQP